MINQPTNNPSSALFYGYKTVDTVTHPLPLKTVSSRDSLLRLVFFFELITFLKIRVISANGTLRPLGI